MKMNGVIYARVSTDEQAKKDCSIPTQINKNTVAMKEDGVHLLEIFKDEGLSGSNPNRQGLQEMIHYCKNNKVDYIYVVDTDRIARDESLHFAIKSMLMKTETKVKSVNQPMLDESPEGKFMDSILAAVNALSPKITGRKTSMTMIEKVQLGWWPGPARVGYLNAVDERTVSGLERNIIVRDEKIAPLVKKSFKLFSTGKYSLDDLREYMFREGLISKKGNKISKQGMANILREQYYTGKIEYKGEVYQGKHHPIIDVKTFEQCNEILKLHNKFAERKRKHTFLLSGHIICGKCGKHYTAEHHGEKEKAYYHCPSSVSIHSNKYQNIDTDSLEKMVERLFKRIELPQSLIQKIIIEAKKYLSQNHNHVDIVKKRLLEKEHKLEERRTNFEIDLGDRVIDSETYLRQTATIKEELADIQNKLGKLGIYRENNTKIFEELMIISEDVYKAYKLANLKRKRAYIDLFWNSIIIEDKKIKKAVPTELFQVLLFSQNSLKSTEKIINTSLWLPELDSNQ